MAHSVSRHAYGREPDQFGELWLPEGAPAAVAIVIHGGCWRAPYDLGLMDAVCADLARRGIAAWNLEYRRLGTGGGWPATADDVAAGCDALPVAGGAPLVVIGHSAGGQLALWAAARSRPACAVSLAGMIDLRACHRLGTCDGAAAELLGGSPEEVPERYAAASPAELVPLGVPQVLVHGTADVHVEPAITDSYAARALGAGDDVTVLRPEGVDHFAPIDPVSAAWDATVALVWDTLAPCP